MMASTGRRAFHLSAAAAVILIALGALITTARPWYREHTRGIPALVAAADAMPSRPTAARLSGGFPYRPLRISPRGADTLRVQPWRLASAVAGVGARAKVDRSANAAHAAGLAYLLTNNGAAAVDALEEALRLDTRTDDLEQCVKTTSNSDILSDLAAAYLARAEEQEGLDTLAALNAAERAWALARKPEVAWNRAIARSAGSASDTAAAAWRDYVSIDPNSRWTAEALERLTAASSKSRPTREAVWHAIEEALSATSENALLRAVAMGPGDARLMAEDVLLPEWGRGDNEALQRAHRVGDAILRISGDHMTLESFNQVASLRGPREIEIRRALVRYGEGRKALQGYHYDQAEPLLRNTLGTMRSYGVPLYRRAALYLANLEFYDKKPDESLATCAEAAREADVERYPALAAQCAWNEGMVETSRRRFDRARVAFEASRAIFGRMRDMASVTALDVRIAENYRWTGDVAKAWTFMSQALAGGAAAREYLPYAEAARTAEAANLPFAALSFYDGAIVAAERRKSAAELTDSHLSRARVFSRLGFTDEGRQELAAAWRSRDRIADHMAAARFNAPFAITDGTFFASAEPDRVLAALQTALSDLSSAGTRRTIPLAHVVAARAYRAKHDDASAEKSLINALAEIERQRTEIAADEERMALMDTSRQATELLVALLYDGGRYGDALLAVERSKARLLRDAIGIRDENGTANVASIPLPANRLAYIEYFVLDDRLLIWTITANGIRSRSVPIERSRLRRRVNALQRAIIVKTDVRSTAEELFRLVLAPVWIDLGHCERLVMVADDCLHRLSFSILIGPEGRHLIEDRVLTAVPSLTWLTDRERNSTADGPIQRAVVVAPATGANGSTATFAQLPAAEQETTIVAERFADTVVLSQDAATCSRFEAAARDSDLIHFAGHAVIDEHRPSRSALVMSGGTLLRSSDIGQWHLRRTRIAVLAACSTGIGRATSDGTASLARAFLLAGSHSVVATLWPVADDQASAFSRRFYAALAARRSGKAALTAAQLSLMRESRTQDQYDWAAFQWVGM
jgi:CHAT domain-containing protein